MNGISVIAAESFVLLASLSIITPYSV